MVKKYRVLINGSSIAGNGWIAENPNFLNANPILTFKKEEARLFSEEEAERIIQEMHANQAVMDALKMSFLESVPAYDEWEVSIGEVAEFILSDEFTQLFSECADSHLTRSVLLARVCRTMAKEMDR